MPSSYHAPSDDRARLEQAVNGLLLLDVLARKAAGVIDQPQKYELILPEGISVADERPALEQVLDALAWVLLFEQRHRVTLVVPGLQLEVPTVGEGDGTNRALDVVPVTVTRRDDHAGGDAALEFVVGGRRRHRVSAHCVLSPARWMVSGYAAYEDPDTTRDDSPER